MTNLKFLIVLVALGSMIQNPLQAQHFRYNIAENLFDRDLDNDSAKSIVLLHLDNAAISNDTSLMIQCMTTLSALERDMLRFSNSFEYCGEAVFLAEEYSDVVLKAIAHQEFGVLYYMFRQTEDADFHLKESDKYYTLAYQQQLIPKSELFHAKYYLMLNSHRQKDLDLTQQYMDSCYALLNTTHIDPLNRTLIDREKAYFLLSDGEIKNAKNLLRKNAQILENLHINKTDRNMRLFKDYLKILYSAMANMSSVAGQEDSTLLYYKKAIHSTLNQKDFIFHSASAYFKYASALAKLGNHKEAYEYSIKGRQILEKYLNPRRVTNNRYLSVINPYTEELQRKNNELAQKNLQLSQNKQDILKLRLLLIIITSVVILSSILILFRVQMTKQGRKLKVKEELLEHKNKELTANMLQLIEKEEQIKTLGESLKNADCNNASKAIIASIESRSTNLWESFNTRFMEVNSGFYERLQKRYPNLSVSELKLCALIKLNFTGKEMAHLLGISPGSVNVARHRLRKKLNMEKEASLTSLIQSF